MNELEFLARNGPSRRPTFAGGQRAFEVVEGANANQLLFVIDNRIRMQVTRALFKLFENLVNPFPAGDVSTLVVIASLT
jgi:hypothetical protein